ncbi:hypothetical protein STEG23_037775 [Scotinomys teguina]
MVRLAWSVALRLSPSFSLAKQWLLRIRCREDFTIRPLGSETSKTSAALSPPPPLLAVRKMAPALTPAFIRVVTAGPAPTRRRERDRVRRWGHGVEPRRKPGKNQPRPVSSGL